MVADAVTGERLPFPDAVRVRRYHGEFTNGTAMLTAMDGTGNRVSLGGIDQYDRGQPLMFVKEETLTIIVPGNLGQLPRSPCAGGDYWWEDFGRQEYFEFCGSWEAPMRDATLIEGTMNGVFAYYRGPGAPIPLRQACLAADHHFTLTRD